MKYQGFYNFWGEVSSGVVDVEMNEDNVPKRIRETIEFFRRMIAQRELKVFQGPLHDRDKKLCIGKDDILSMNDLFNMVWISDQYDSILEE